MNKPNWDNRYDFVASIEGTQECSFDRDSFDVNWEDITVEKTKTITVWDNTRKGHADSFFTVDVSDCDDEAVIEKVTEAIDGYEARLEGPYYLIYQGETIAKINYRPDLNDVIHLDDIGEAYVVQSIHEFSCGVRKAYGYEVKR